MLSNLKTVKGLETKKFENCCVTYEGKCSSQHMITECFLPAVDTTLTEKVLVILSRFTSSQSRDVHVAKELSLCPECITVSGRYCVRFCGIQKLDSVSVLVLEKLAVPEWVEVGNVRISHSGLLSSNMLYETQKELQKEGSSEAAREGRLIQSLDAVRRGEGGDCSVKLRYSWVLAVSHEAYFSSFIFSSHSDSFSLGCIQFPLMGCVALYLFVSGA